MHSLSIILYSGPPLYHCIGILYKKKLAICEWKEYELQQLNTRCQMIAPAIFVVLWPSIVNVIWVWMRKKIDREIVCVMHYGIFFSRSLLSGDYMQIKRFFFCDFLRHIRVCGFGCRDFIMIWIELWWKIACIGEFFC